MVPSEDRAATGPPVAEPPKCPECGGALSEPISGAIHCHRTCGVCGEKFDLDDPRLSEGSHR